MGKANDETVTGLLVVDATGGKDRATGVNSNCKGTFVSNR